MEHIRINGRISGGFESLTVDNTVGGVGFTAAKYLPTTGDFIGRRAQEAICRFYSATLTSSIRFTTDGTAPTISVGTVLKPFEILTLDNPTDIVAFRAIIVSGTCTLDSTFQFDRRA
jgi:hypothetical protein